MNTPCDNTTLIISVIAVILSIISIISTIIISVKSWARNRSIFDLEELMIRKIDGSRNDAGDRGFGAVREKLQTGKYTIETTYDRTDGDLAILLSKIKK